MTLLLLLTYTNNTTAAYINVSYLNITGHANQVTATVYLSNVDGTNTTVNTTTLTTSNSTFSYLVQPYSGKSYTVKLTIYNDSLVCNIFSLWLYIPGCSS